LELKPFINLKDNTTMVKQKKLTRICHGIKMLETAIFYDFSTSLVKFPNSLISVTHIDYTGQLRFMMFKPYKDLTGINKVFFAQLKFYNKNYNYQITVQGKAAILEEMEEQSEEEKLLIGFQIEQAEYWRKMHQHHQGLLYYFGKVKDWLPHF
jgi:hypothetical protein